MKLMPVSRREFIHEEYLDCDSCDELSEEKVRFLHRCDIYKVVDVDVEEQQ